MDGYDSDVIQSLQHRWNQLTDSLNEEVRNKWWETILTKYTEATRKYHNVIHIHKMFQHFDAYHEFLSSPEAVEYAIYFHDLEYDPKTGDNEEKSIELFQQFATEAGIIDNTELVTKVKELIELTKTHSTDEHKSVGAFGKDDKHFFLDFDVSVLGSDENEYNLYTSQICEEYSFLSSDTYNFLRAKVLKSFLQIPNIFATKQFRENYENQAKSNIRQEISSLEANSK